MKKQKTGNNGFTLAELLIVVAVIGVLVAISMPVFAGHLEKSRETVDLANVRSAYSEVMTAVMTEDTANYSRTVKLKQKRDNWNAYDPVTVAGITHSRDEGNTEHWIGIPVENGECTLSYIPGFGMKVIWSGAGGNDTPISFPYNDNLHGALDKTGILNELIKQNKTYFEIDSKCPKSDMLTRVNEEIRKEGSSSLLGTGTWAYMGSPKKASGRYLFWTSMDTDQVGAGKKIPVIVSKADGGFYISETTTAARKKDGKTYVAIAGHIADFSPYTSGKKYDSLEDAYNAYQKLLADGTYEKAS